MRRGGVAVSLGITAIAAVLLWRYGPDWREALDVARQASPADIALTVAFQALYYLFASLLLRAVLDLLDVHAPMLWTLEATFLLVALSRALPGPGATGPAVLFLLLRRRGCPADRAAAAGPLFFLVDYAVYAVLLTGSLASMAAGGAGTGGAAAAVLGAMGAIGLLGWALLHPERLERNVTRLARVANRCLERVRVRWRAPGGGAVRAMVEDMSSRLWRRPRIGSALAAFGMLMALSDAASMASAFRAFGAGIGPAQAVAGYCIATLGALVSVLPAGLGTFDAAMALGFSGVGSGEMAAAAQPAVIASGIVLYRAVATLLPTAATFIALHRLRGRGTEAA